MPSGRFEGSSVAGVADVWSWDGLAEGRQPGSEGSEGRSVGQGMLGFPGVGSTAEEVAFWVMVEDVGDAD